MTTQTDFKQIGEDYLEHYGKMGMRWGRRGSKSSSNSKSSNKTNRPHKASPGNRPVSRKRAVSYTVAGAVGGGAGALGLLAANRVLRSSDAKVKSKNAFKRGTKSTLLVLAKTGSVVASSLIATVGAVVASQAMGDYIDRNTTVTTRTSTTEGYMRENRV